MSLLERGNTRLAPLDTVEPDAFMYLLRGTDSEPSLHVARKEHFVNGIPREYWDEIELLSTPKVESMLSQCRKEALLEAAAFIQKKADIYPDTLGSYYRINDANELRRMAESTMEGEKSEHY